MSSIDLPYNRLSSIQGCQGAHRYLIYDGLSRKIILNPHEFIDGIFSRILYDTYTLTNRYDSIAVAIVFKKNVSHYGVKYKNQYPIEYFGFSDLNDWLNYIQKEWSR